MGFQGLGYRVYGNDPRKLENACFIFSWSVWEMLQMPVFFSAGMFGKSSKYPLLLFSVGIVVGKPGLPR